MPTCCCFLCCAPSRPETPLSLYKQAVRLVQQQPCGDVSADAVMQEKLNKAITLLEAQQQSEAEQTGQAALGGPQVLLCHLPACRRLLTDGC